MTSTIMESMSSIPASKVQEIKMMLSNDANKGKCIMLLEGPDDRKFYGSFVNDDSIELNVLGTCYYMPVILQMTSLDNTLKDRVIGIKDADFDHITGKVYDLECLFITDTHDWETMVMTESCECRVALECLDRKEKGLFTQVMQHLEYYSYTKLFNEIEVLGKKDRDGILFRGLSLSKFYDGENACGLKECLEAIKSHGNNSALPYFPTEQEISDFKVLYPRLDLYQLTCGHDVIHGLVCRFKKITGRNPEQGKREIALIFRLSYNLDFFKTTQLYQNVKRWGASHSVQAWVA